MEDQVVDLGVGIGGLHHAMVENRQMRVELEELRARQLLLEADLEAMRQLGDFAGPDGEFESGSVVGRCAYRDLSSGMMEVRTAQKMVLARDTPVISANGLVGRVPVLGRSVRKKTFICVGPQR